ncbi:hypothetical protein BKA70DRAFT_1102988, partial [Coprinopsis sp. MPI-PUGE-AT-0042]
LNSYGDYHRGCQHFKMHYYSGDKVDCESPSCYHSSKHTHKAPNCPCSREQGDERKVVNLFHAPCDDCRNAEFHRRVGR